MSKYRLLRSWAKMELLKQFGSFFVVKIQIGDILSSMEAVRKKNSGERISSAKGALYY
jgi:hypothetical protein